MKNYANIALTVILTFIITLVLNTAIEYFLRDKATYELQMIEQTSGQNIAKFRIKNFSRTSINRFKLLVPKSVDISQISSTQALKIEDSEYTISNENLRLLEFSLIPPNAITEILIPVEVERDCCSAANLDELKIADKSNVNIRNPITEAMYDAFIMATIYSFLLSLFLLWMKGQTDKLRTYIEESKAEAEKRVKRLESSVKKSFKDLAETKKAFAQLRLIQGRKISDYSKELEFWRNTIRKYLYQSSVDKSNAEELISQITTVLGTYSTRSSNRYDFEAIEALAKEISNSKTS